VLIMTVSKIQPAVLAGLTTAEVGHSPVAAPLRARLAARLRSAHCDRALERCEPVEPASPLAVHVARLKSAAERAQLADTLRRARQTGGRGSLQVPLHRAKVAAAVDLIDAVAVRLAAPAPVGARGVARLRLLLADGAGPMYVTGRGSLNAELRGVLAVL
jgi:hypothetical protein